MLPLRIFLMNDLRRIAPLIAWLFINPSHVTGQSVLPVPVTIPSPSVATGPVALAIGPEQLVIPLNQYGLKFTPDEHLSYVRYADGSSRVFWAGGTSAGAGNSVAMVTTDFATFAPLVSKQGNAVSVFSPSGGGTTAFDGDYAGPGTVMLAANGKDLLMFYHGENHFFNGVDYPFEPFYAAIGLARSTDNGVSWQRQGEIISGMTPYPTTTPPRNALGAANPSVIAVNGFLYLYYIDIGFNSGPDVIHVARSPISSDGAVGTWQKWYQGSFSQPGLGGLSSPVQGQVPPGSLTISAGLCHVSFNTYLQKYLMVFQTADGFYYSTSPDLTTWTVQGRLVAFGADNDNLQTGQTFFDYPTLISPDQPSDQLTSQTAYLYYAKGVWNQVNHTMYRRAVNFGAAPAAQLPAVSITIQPSNQAVKVGATVSLGVTATGTPPLTYQWQINGTAVPGAVSSTLNLASAAVSDAGSYSCVVTDVMGKTAISSAATLNVGAARLTNLSVRTLAGTGAQTLITGFAIGGSGSKVILARAIGPTLADFGVSGVLTNPSLALYGSDSRPFLTPSGGAVGNTVWNGNPVYVSAFAQVGAFPLPLTSKDSVFEYGVPAGSYSIQISPATGGSGVALAEIYDADTANVPTTRFINLSARSQAGAGSQTLITGFSISGNTSMKLLIRGIGPTLGGFGVAGALADPQLALFDSTSNRINTNDDWGGTAELSNAFAQVGAFAMPANSKDAALLVTLPPGSYSAQVSGVGGATGVALVEVYEVP